MIILDNTYFSYLWKFETRKLFVFVFPSFNFNIVSAKAYTMSSIYTYRRKAKQVFYVDILLTVSVLCYTVA